MQVARLVEPEQSITLFANHEGEAMAQMAMAAHEIAYESGVERGRLRGVEQGLEQDPAHLLPTQREARFGPLSDSTRERVEHAARGLLERWALRALSGASIEDVLGG